MSWNGSGTFNRTFSWAADKNAGLNISSSRMDTDTNDITSNGFGNCLTRDGQGQPTANLPMATFRHTGVGNGVVRSDYAAMGQSQDGTINWTTAGGTADALTATYSPALTALIDGQLCFVRAAAANATTTPTFAPNGLTAHTITKVGGTALVAGEIAGNLHELVLRYNLTNTRWELLNPAPTIAAGTQNPTGSVLDYAGSTAPPGYYLCDGSAKSRTSDAALFAVIGTTYGAGDGSTTFNLPDVRGRVSVGKDNMGVGAANRVTTAGSSIDGATLGANGGAENVTLQTANLPAYTPAGSVAVASGSITGSVALQGGSNTAAGANPQDIISGGATSVTISDTRAWSFTGTAQGGTSTAVNKMPPAIIFNKIIKA